jgi:virginiamycin B lyase
LERTRSSCRSPVCTALGVILTAVLCASLAPAVAASETVFLTPESLREISLENEVGEIAFGVEGGIWYDHYNHSEIFRVTQAGVPTGDFKVTYGEGLGLAPAEGYISNLTAGSDGALWFVDQAFTDQPSQVLGRIDTIGRTTEYVVEGPTGNIAGLAAGPGAKIWFTVDENAGAIKRIGPNNHVEAFFPPTGSARALPEVSEPGPITVGPDGAMWFIDDGTNDEGHNLVGRIAPNGEIVEYPLPGTQRAWSIVAGPGGYVWIATGMSTLYRVALDGSVTVFQVPHTVGELQGIVAGPEGDIWYLMGQYYNVSTLGRVTPDGESTLFEPPDLSLDLGSPRLGPDGDLWFADRSSLIAMKPPLSPVDVFAPTIEGNAEEGQALTASPGEWQNATALSFRWSLCDASGANCEILFGQEGRTIALLPLDVGHTLSVAVTASGAGGSTTVQSAPSSVIRSLPVAIVTHGSTDNLEPPPVLAPTLATTMTWEFGWSRHGTRVKSLRLHNVPPGAELEVRCRGKACPFTARRIRGLSSAAFKRCEAGPCLSAHGGEVEISMLWHDRRLPAGDRVEVVVTRTGYRGKLFPYVMRHGGPPRPPVIQCLAPGSSKQPQAC